MCIAYRSLILIIALAEFSASSNYADACDICCLSAAGIISS
tara:strand:- start:79 stop:201 length:123 start_codon:yes stop_codon:yes gene_type:complete